MFIEIESPSFLAEGSRIQGALLSSSATGIYGTIEGEVIHQSGELLQIGRSGWVHGNIKADGPVLIEGRVDGSIFSETKVTFSPTAVVKGSVKAPRIEVRPGALFEGNARIGETAVLSPVLKAA